MLPREVVRDLGLRCLARLQNKLCCGGRWKKPRLDNATAGCGTPGSTHVKKYQAHHANVCVVLVATAIMRAKSLLGDSGTTWVVQAPRLPREKSKPAVHALGCVRRRGWLQSPQSCSTAEEVGAEGTCLFGRHRCRRMVPPVRAGGQSRAEELADEGSTLKREEGSSDASRAEQFADGEAGEGEAISRNGQHHKNEERERSTKLTPTQLQQQALIRRLKTLEARRDWRGVLAAMDSARNEKVILSRVVYNKAVISLAKSGRWREAITLVENMRGDGLTPDEYSYAGCIDACAKAMQWKKACQLLDEMRAAGVQPNGYAFNAAINACGKAHMWEEALALLQQMEREGVEVTTVTLNAAMDACGISGEWRAALTMLESMQAKGSPQRQRPNSRTFNIAIKACAKVAEWQTALDLLAQLRAGALAKGGEPLLADTVSFNATINALGRGGEWEKALALLREMSKAGRDVAPNAISYNSAIHACGRGGQWQLALSLLKEMRELGLPPDQVSFGATANALGRAGQWMLVLELLKEMKADGNPPTEVAFKAAVDCCSKADEWQHAVALIQSMRVNGYPPAVLTLSSVIAACGRAGQWEVALALLHDTRKRGPPPTASVYIATAQACARAGKWEEATELKEGMEEDGVRQTEKFYMALLRATGEGNRTDKTIHILQEMREAGLTPGVRSYNCAVGACGKAGSWQRAITLLSEMYREGMRPAGFAVAATIRACGAGGEWRKGLQVLRRSQDIRLSKPDPCSLSAAIEICCHAGELEHARNILPHLKALSGSEGADAWLRDTMDILNACSVGKEAGDETAQPEHGDGGGDTRQSRAAGDNDTNNSTKTPTKGDATNYTSGGQELHQACTAVDPGEPHRSRSKRPAGVADSVAFPEEVHQLSPLGGVVGKVAKVPAARRRTTDAAPDLLVKLSHGGTTT